MPTIVDRLAGCGHCCNAIAIITAVVFASLTASELNSRHDAGKLQVYEHKDEPWCHMMDQAPEMLVDEMFGVSFKVADKLEIAKVTYNKKECGIQPAKREAWNLQGWEKSDVLDYGQRNYTAAIFMFTLIKLVKAGMSFWSYLHPTENMMATMVKQVMKDRNEDSGAFCLELCCGIPMLAACQFLVGWIGNFLISPIVTMRLDENAKNIIYMKFSYQLWWWSTWSSFALVAWPGFCFCIFLCLSCFYGEDTIDKMPGKILIGVLLLGVAGAAITVIVMFGMYIAAVGFAIILAVDLRLTFNFSLPSGIIAYSAVAASAVVVNVILDALEFCYIIYEIFVNSKKDPQGGSSQQANQA
eukprot:TRINITY_DN5759_c0_g1_i1.p1 TRINITY_DN5759_c0_g1~~TRINITY_DN5759_c0_g1_i1.p1  ORF type:complete len:366 (+),score=48.49 TRINITY_DN5759_c0_g1_i1:31-1098(+)